MSLGLRGAKAGLAPLLCLSESEGSSYEDGEPALGTHGGSRAPYLEGGAGWAHRLPKAGLKKACVDGLISGFGK